MKITRAARLPRPQPLRALPGHAPHRRSRRARGLADRRRSPASPTALLARCPTLARAHAARYGERGRLRAPPDRGRRHLARPRPRARRDRAPAARPAPRSPSARRAAPATPGHYHVVYEYEEERVGEAAGDLALKLHRSTCCPPSCAPDDAPARRSTSRPSSTSSSTSRSARQLGPSTGVARPRRRGARHPVAAPERLQPRPVRPRQVPEAHPGDGHARDAPHRRRDRLGQGGDQPHPRRSRPAGAAPAAGALAPSRRCAPPSGSATPSSSSRSTPTTAAASRSACTTDDAGRGRVREGARARAHASSSRPSSTGFDHRMLVVERRAHRRRQARPRPRRRRRRAHHRRSSSTIVNPDPRRGIGHEKVLTRLELDAPGRAPDGAKGVTTEDTVPPAGEIVFLRATGNLSTGGTAIDLTDVVHPDNREMAVRAAKAIGLDVVRHRLHHPRHHAELPRGRRRHLRGQRRARLPHARRADRGQAARRRRAGHRHAVPAGHAGAHPDRRDHRHQRQDDDRAHARAHPQDDRPHRRPHHDRRRLHRRRAHGRRRHDRARSRRRWSCAIPTVDIAVLETARGGLLRAGMGYRSCDVGAVLNVTADHLGLKRHRHARAARRGEAHRRRGRARLRRAQRRRPRSA